jgi:thiol-disulfide isomerase/thioredoxin
MTNRRNFLILAIILLLLYGGLHYLIRHKQPTPLIEGENTLSTAQLFAQVLPDQDGKLQALQQWQGKLLIVNFWATWCGPCRDEMPDLQEIYTRYQTQDVMVVGIAADDVAKIREFTKTLPVSYPLVSAEPDTMELSALLGNTRGVLPYTVIIDNHGKIVTSFTGRLNRALIESALLPLLSSAKITP